MNLSFQFSSCIDFVTISAQLVYFVSVFDSSPKPLYLVKLLRPVFIFTEVIFQLHGVAPRPLAGHHQKHNEPERF